MRKFFLRRTMMLLPTLLGIVILVFFLVRAIPGNPVQVMLGIEGADPEVQKRLEHSLGLDRPVPVQFGIYLLRASRGDFGTSLRTGRPVLDEIRTFLPNTLQLASVAFVLSVIIALPAGIISAVRRNSVVDNVVMLFALAGVSMPSFWLGLLLIVGVAYSLGVLPISGMGFGLWDALRHLLVSGDASMITAAIRHLILPSITLGAVNAAVLARLTRSTMLDVMGQDYIRTARSKGLNERAVIYRHALKNALIPIITVLALRVGQMLGGAVIVETVFAWPGIGRLMVRAINQRDYPMVQVLILTFATARVIMNLIADFAYGWVDPRVRYE